jgi:hypothetical protein
MRKLPFVLSLLIIGAFSSPAFSQGDNSVLKNIIGKLGSFYSGHIIEKAYLHFDRPYYAAGDTIYFKAYVTFGEQHELSRQSGVLYVDLINPQNIINRSIKLSLKDGLAWGDFALSDSLPKGNYRIRAYTKLIKNAVGGDFFEQMIPVGSTVNNTNAIKLSQNTNKPDVQFFPEGGELLAGVQSKVAFKAIGPDGMGVNIKGTIIDNSGKAIASFGSSHLGMGSFDLAPEDGKTYKANIKFADGSQNTVDLPAVGTKGILLAINNSDPDKLTVGINCSNAFYTENQHKDFNLVINSGVSVSSAIIKLNNLLIAADLQKSQFRTGIVQFTLFSPSGYPLSERIVFIQRPEMLKLKINSNKAAYNTHEKVLLSLNAKNRSDSVVSGHFSVSVIDESKIPVNEDKESTILSYLLLTSDLKGYVEQPNCYFTNATNEAQANLDVLMLTQGYRRFAWKQLLDNKYPSIADQPQKALEVKGLVTTLQGKPVVKNKVNLISIDGGPMLSQLTDSLGGFNFTGLSFPDNAHFIIKAASEKDRNKMRIEYMVDAPEPVTTNYWSQEQSGSDSLMAISLLNRKTEMNYQAKYRAVTESSIKNADVTESNGERYGVLKMAGKADQVVSHDDLKGSGLLSDHLNGLLNGINFIGDPSNVKVPYLSAGISLGTKNEGNPPMLVIVDGVNLPLGSSVDDINLNEVEKVEVFKSAAAFGSLGGAGVLSLTTKRGSTQSINQGMAMGMLPITAHGYYKAREFYSPKYETGSLTNHRNELRTTIYWNPELVTDKAGNASFEYYNAEGPGTYRVVIEGIDDKGNIGRQVYRYKVD